MKARRNIGTEIGARADPESTVQREMRVAGPAVQAAVDRGTEQPTEEPTVQHEMRAAQPKAKGPEPSRELAALLT